MASPGLGLTASRHRTLFRKVVETMKYDGTLSRVIRTWIVWDGSDEDRLNDIDLSPTHCPVLTLAPVRGADTWYGPDSYQGSLIIRVGLVTEGTDIDDLLDLYEAVIKATWPSDATARETINNDFVDAGALGYALQMATQPAFGYTGPPDAPLMLAQGQFTFPVSTGINP